MNNVKTIILIAGILVAGVAFNSVAQENPPKKEDHLTTLYSYKHDKARHKADAKSHKHYKNHGLKAHKMNKHSFHHKSYKHHVKSDFKRKSLN